MLSSLTLLLLVSAPISPAVCVRVRAMMRMNCSTEWAAAAAHHPVRIANVTLRDSVRTQLAVFDRPDVVSNRLSQRAHTFEPAEIAAFAALLRPETVVLDIGANIGWWTFNFATTHAVHAFEPNPSNLALQALSRCMNPHLAQRITVYPVGLYNREPARCELYSHRLNLGNTHTLCGTPEEILEAKIQTRKTLERRGSSVEMRTLDTLVPEWLFHADKIVKLDVEGSEQVWRSWAPRGCSLTACRRVRSSWRSPSTRAPSGARSTSFWSATATCPRVWCNTICSLFTRGTRVPRRGATGRRPRCATTTARFAGRPSATPRADSRACRIAATGGGAVN